MRMELDLGDLLRSFRTENLSRVSMLQAAALAAVVEASKAAPAAVWAMAVAAAMVATWVAATTDSSISPTLV